MRKPCDVLVIEDDPDLRLAVGAVLTDFRLSVCAFADPVTAITAALGYPPPCVILVDLQLAGIDGGRVVERLRDVGVPSPIVVMSAMPDLGRRARRLDAAGYLAKPFGIPELVAAVAPFCHPPYEQAPVAVPRRAARVATGPLSTSFGDLAATMGGVS